MSSWKFSTGLLALLLPLSSTFGQEFLDNLLGKPRSLFSSDSPATTRPGATKPAPVAPKVVPERYRPAGLSVMPPEHRLPPVPQQFHSLPPATPVGKESPKPVSLPILPPTGSTTLQPTNYTASPAGPAMPVIPANTPPVVEQSAPANEFYTGTPVDTYSTHAPIYCRSECDFGHRLPGQWLYPGTGSWQILMGGFFSTAVGPTVPPYEYAPLSIRRGWMLGNLFPEKNIYPGSFEVLLDLSLAVVTSSYGDIHGGPSAIFRYNIPAMEGAVNPYIQASAGFVINDAYKDSSQRAIGQAFEFLLGTAAGIRIMLSDDVSFDVEVGFEHMSNFSLGERNLGITNYGARFGWTYYFPN
ncbi:MAG: acyloxyacyl hydrolase [Zavarzinella sp.]